MADLKKLKKYIKLSDLKKGDKVTFTNAGEIKDIDFSPAKDGSKVKTCFQVEISVNGEDPKEIVLNSTTTNNLSKFWSEDTSKWVGKVAKPLTIKQVAFGKVQDVTYLEPEDEVAWDENK